MKYSDLNDVSLVAPEETTLLPPETTSDHPAILDLPPRSPDVHIHDSSDTDSSDSMPDEMCRICRFGAGSEKMISPCNCNGTLQFVHQSCLLKWLKSNDRINKHHCELCQYEFLLKPRPWIEWKMPSLSATEQRRATCLVVICVLAILIVIWSINDLIQNIKLTKIYMSWGFWTKLLFIAFGLVILGFQYPTFRYFFVKLNESNQIVLLNEESDVEGGEKEGKEEEDTCSIYK